MLVAGAVGPMNRTLSLSPNVEDSAFRNVSKFIFMIAFEEIQASYEEQIEALVDGGVDIIFI